MFTRENDFLEILKERHGKLYGIIKVNSVLELTPKILIEKKFEIHLKSGYDMRMYLYYPQSLLSDKIRAYLDELLLNEAYKCIDDAKFNVEKFTVYKDEISKKEAPFAKYN